MADPLRVRLQYSPKSPAVAVRVAERGLTGATGATGPQGPQGPQGPTGSSVPATTTSLGGVIVGGGLSVITAGNATTNGTLSTNATLIGLGNVDNTRDLDKPVSNLTQTALAGKAALVHTHVIGEVTGLQTALDGKQSTGNYVLSNDTRLSDARTPLAHMHAIGEVTGLQTALDGKLSITSANATFQPISGMSIYLTANLAATSYYPLTGNPSGFITSSALSPYAPLANASLTGTPTAPTPTAGANTTQIATAQFVTTALATYQTIAGMASYAPLASPTFTGTPAAPTAANGTNTTQLATTAFVANALSAYITTATAASTYLTTTAAASTYAPISTTVTLTGAQTVQTKQLQSWRETFTTPAISAGTLTLDLSGSNFFKVSLNAAITTLTISNTPSGAAASFTLEFTADGTARAVTWPTAVKWPGGTAPTLTSTLNKTDTFVFYTTDGGSTWKAFITGQNS